MSEVCPEGKGADGETRTPDPVITELRERFPRPHPQVPADGLDARFPRKWKVPQERAAATRSTPGGRLPGGAQTAERAHDKAAVGALDQDVPRPSAGAPAHPREIRDDIAGRVTTLVRDLDAGGETLSDDNRFEGLLGIGGPACGRCDRLGLLLFTSFVVLFSQSPTTKSNGRR